MTSSFVHRSWSLSRRPVRHVLAAAVLACCASGSQALEFETSGFATLAVGRSSGPCVSGLVTDRLNDECTRFVADWAHAGVYERKWNAQPESRLGVQGTAKFNSQFSLTSQITARALNRQHLNLEWLYGEYRITPQWSVQVGRKRLPLFYYSDFQDVGYAYNTVRPSPDVYGWDVVNYNGASVAYNASVGEWAVRAEVLTGRENSRKNPFSRIFNAPEQDVRWSGIGGVTAEASKDWFSTRISYIRSSYEQTEPSTGTLRASGGKKHEFIGAAFNADLDDWILRSEVGTTKRESLGYRAAFYLLTAGYRIGDLTITGGHSRYREKVYDTGVVRFDHDSPLLALRYEVHKGGAVKLQVERLKDRTPPPVVLGSTNVVTATYDLVF